jgi:hypothetical protein
LTVDGVVENKYFSRFDCDVAAHEGNSSTRYERNQYKVRSVPSSVVSRNGDTSTKFSATPFWVCERIIRMDTGLTRDSTKNTQVKRYDWPSIPKEMVVWPNEIDTCEQTKKSTPVS